MTTATMEKPKTAKPPKKIRFRLLRARHIETEYEHDEKGNIVLDKNGKWKKIGTTPYQVVRDPVTKRPQQPVFESYHELDKKFNAPGYPPKFERVGEPERIVINPVERQPGETLQAYIIRLGEFAEQAKALSEDSIKRIDAMDKDQLAELAAQEEIDISKCKDVINIKATIKAALKG